MRDANQANVLNALAALCRLETKLLSAAVTDPDSGKPVEPDVPDGESGLFALKDWSFRCIPLVKAFAIVDGDVCQEG